jgi:hypothetical protein
MSTGGIGLAFRGFFTAPARAGTGRQRRDGLRALLLAGGNECDVDMQHADDG